MSDGDGGLAITKVGTGTLTLAAETLRYTGATTVNGGALRLLPDDYVRSPLIRLTILAHRPLPDGATAGQGTEYYNTGFQFREFQLTYKGTGLQWPSLDNMVVEGTSPNTDQAAKHVVDNNLNTKWYVNNSVSLPVSLTLACDEPMTFDGYRIYTAEDAMGRDPISWTLEGGSLPAGLNLYGNGVISGAPITDGTFEFTVKATNGMGNDTKTLVITVGSVGIVETHGSASPIQVYPNPTRGELKIENVEVYNITGQKIIFNFQLSTFNSFDISHLPSGIYFLRIQTENGTVTRKIIKN